MNPDDLPEIRRVKPPEPKPEEVRFVAKLDCPPLDMPQRERIDPLVAKRRAHAEHFCLWLGCSRALCRRARHCHGPNAACVFEMADVAAPLLG